MMKYYYESIYTYLLSLLLVSVIGIVNYKRLDKGARIFWLQNCIAFVGEVLAHISAKAFRTNRPVYAILNIIEVAVLLWYFNETIPLFRKRNTGLWLSAAIVVVGIINIGWFQPLNKWNGNFLLVSAVVIIATGMLSLSRLLLDYEYIHIRYEPHFWITSILIMYWVLLFTCWGLYDHLSCRLKTNKWIIDSFILILNIGTELAYAWILIRFSKMKTR